MHASAYTSIHAGSEVSVSTTDPTAVAEALQQLGELMPRALIKSWWLGEFKLSGPGWYSGTSVGTHGPAIGLWLVGQLCSKGWEVFQVNQGDTTGYHLPTPPDQDSLWLDWLGLALWFMLKAWQLVRTRRFA